MFSLYVTLAAVSISAVAAEVDAPPPPRSPAIVAADSISFSWFLSLTPRETQIARYSGRPDMVPTGVKVVNYLSAAFDLSVNSESGAVQRLVFRGESRPVDGSDEAAWTREQAISFIRSTDMIEKLGYPGGNLPLDLSPLVETAPPEDAKNQITGRRIAVPRVAHGIPFWDERFLFRLGVDQETKSLYLKTFVAHISQVSPTNPPPAARLTPAATARQNALEWLQTQQKVLTALSAKDRSELTLKVLNKTPVESVGWAHRNNFLHSDKFPGPLFPDFSSDVTPCYRTDVVIVGPAQLDLLVTMYTAIDTGEIAAGYCDAVQGGSGKRK